MANFITGIRVVCAVLLIPCPAFTKYFYVLYLVGGLSDALDGYIARHGGKETELGARLDTVADIVFTAVVLIKVLRAVQFPLWLLVWIACIAVIKLINIAGGFIMHGHFVSEHTVMNKITGGLLFLLPLGIYRLPLTPLCIPAAAAASFAAVQEGHLIRTGKEIR